VTEIGNLLNVKLGLWFFFFFSIRPTVPLEVGRESGEVIGKCFGVCDKRWIQMREQKYKASRGRCSLGKAQRIQEQARRLSAT